MKNFIILICIFFILILVINKNDAGYWQGYAIEKETGNMRDLWIIAPSSLYKGFYETREDCMHATKYYMESAENYAAESPYGCGYSGHSKYWVYIVNKWFNNNHLACIAKIISREKNDPTYEPIFAPEAKSLHKELQSKDWYCVL